MSDLRFEGRVAIVTGGGRGLGRQHALLLAERGARVVVNDLGPDSADEGPGPASLVVEEIRTKGGEAVPDTHSVATPDGGREIVATALREFGGLDIVVHNAGIARSVGIAEVTSDHVDALLDVHLRGAFFVITAAWAHMRAQSYGRIVNIVSNAGLFGLPGAGAYSAAKGGLVALTKALASEGGAHGIRVNAVAPVAITRLTEGLDAGPLEAWWRRWFDPRHVAPVVAWLAHESCPVSGEVFSAGGGRVARVFVAETPGFWSEDLTLEQVRDNFGQIRAEDGYAQPGSSAEEMALYHHLMPAEGEAP
ncbi:MAG: SDR family NAD(P)-dependent oxidoreductase [Actinobacteria bacterium]|nr:SDR family NAD(P)-dependent oxidoreductase [Actinomycetota bacterium]